MPAWRSSRRVIVPILALLAVGVWACAAGDATEPGTTHTAIPSFAKAGGGGNCAVWSCSQSQCGNDPGVYGACCTEIVEGGQTPQPKPTCVPVAGGNPPGNPPPGGQYCLYLQIGDCPGSGFP